MPKIIDLTGQVFGRLTVIKQNGRDKTNNILWKCLCECGNTKTVRGSHIKSGATKSCGCIARELGKAQLTTHGQRHHPLYRHYESMMSRCNNPNNKAYHRYGGRGIKVCKEWYDNPLQFFNDMGPKPSDKHSIERIDFNADYCPKNCKWATIEEQANNTSSNRFISYNGHTLTIAQWAQKLGVQFGTLYCRIMVYKWDVEKALSTPVKKYRCSKHKTVL